MWQHNDGSYLDLVLILHGWDSSFVNCGICQNKRQNKPKTNSRLPATHTFYSEMKQAARANSPRSSLATLQAVITTPSRKKNIPSGPDSNSNRPISFCFMHLNFNASEFHFLLLKNHNVANFSNRQLFGLKMNCF